MRLVKKAANALKLEDAVNLHFKQPHRCPEAGYVPAIFGIFA
jgi:hypothetical protein